jgi:hypothetical protein
MNDFFYRHLNKDLSIVLNLDHHRHFNKTIDKNLDLNEFLYNNLNFFNYFFDNLYLDVPYLTLDIDLFDFLDLNLNRDLNHNNWWHLNRLLNKNLNRNLPNLCFRFKIDRHLNQHRYFDKDLNNLMNENFHGHLNDLFDINYFLLNNYFLNNYVHRQMNKPLSLYYYFDGNLNDFGPLAGFYLFYALGLNLYLWSFFCLYGYLVGRESDLFFVLFDIGMKSCVLIYTWVGFYTWI